MTDVIFSIVVALASAVAVAGAIRLLAGPAASRRARAVRWTASVAIALPLAAYLLYALMGSRTLQLAGGFVTRVDTREKVVALTFDDGPTAEHTRRVLDILEREDVRGTFFVTGGESDASPALLRAIVEDGHEIGNHTWSHPRLVFLPSSELAREFDRTDSVIRAAGFRGPILVRTPFAKRLVETPLFLARTRRTNVLWDSEADSTAGIADDPDAIVRRTLDDVRPGSIVLMHVMYDAREPSRQALPRIIDGLRARGYRFVTVNELLALSR